MMSDELFIRDTVARMSDNARAVGKDHPSAGPKKINEIDMFENSVEGCVTVIPSSWSIYKCCGMQENDAQHFYICYCPPGN